MKSLKNIHKIIAVTMVAASAVFLSCDMFEDEENTIIITATCTGGTSSETTIKDQFSAIFTIDGKAYSFESTQLTSALPNNTLTLPVGNASKITISATRYDPTSSVLLLIFNNGELDDKGYANLAPCVSTSTTGTPVYTCSNNVSLIWELDAEEDDSSAVSGSTSSSTSSTSSSSEE